MALKAMTSSSLLPAFQSRLLEALRAEGLIAMSTGTTRPVRVAETFSDLTSLVVGEADANKLRFGTRTGDRYSNSTNTYTARRFAMLASLEGISLQSYPDNGNRSVALGFNMDKGNARDVWAEAFGDSVDFDAVYAGKASITTAQAKQLFDHDILYYEKVVDQATAGKALSENQRLGLVSIAVNAPKRLLDLKPTLQSGTPEQITAALLTQTFNPNNPYADALKQRRFIETQIFNSAAEASALMPTFDEYYAAVDISGPETTVNGRTVTPTNTQMAFVPSETGALKVTPLTDSLAAFSYTNQGAQRNLKVSGDLETNIRQSVTAVYGADYRVEIMSGGQEAGVSRGVVGSRRHNHGTAADVWIYDPSGNRLTPEQMRPLAQDWLARDIGSVGLPVPGNGNSLHLDLVGGSGPGSIPLRSGEGRFWFYGGDDTAMRKTLEARVAPSYALSPEAVQMGYVPPGSMPSVGSALSTTSDPPTPRPWVDGTKARIDAQVDAQMLAKYPPALPQRRPEAAPSVMDMAAVKAQEAKTGAVQAVKPPVQGLRLPFQRVIDPLTGLPTSMPATGPNTAVGAFGDTELNRAFDEAFSNPVAGADVKPAPTVPAAVAAAAVPGKSALAPGAQVGTSGTGSMAPFAKPVATAPRPVSKTTVMSAPAVASKNKGVTFAAGKNYAGVSVGSDNVKRAYNFDTNNWDIVG